MNPYRTRQKNNTEMSHASLGTQSASQNTRETLGLDSEPQCRSTTPYGWGSNNPYARILNPSRTEETLPRQPEWDMNCGDSFIPPTSSRNNDQNVPTVIPGEVSDRATSLGRAKSSIPPATPKQPFAVVSRVRSLLQSKPPSIKLPQQVREPAGNTCECCEEKLPDVWFCNICALNFCGKCWDAQVVHRKFQTGISHEKTSSNTAEKVHNVLCPPTDEIARSSLYRADASTAWFGVERPDDSSPPIFHNYGRFTELMEATAPIRQHSLFQEDMEGVSRDRRTPSLVSFVGQTGAGKSSLIKLLIDFAVTSNETFQSPVIGPRGAHVPTSEDVHLYLDPKTTGSDGPLLYADCEGLEGGEREPLGAIFKRKRRQDHNNDNVDSGPGFFKPKVISERELHWADDPRTRSREFAVTNLYPRVLYTFSDVIVFVLRNPRVIEHVFERLVQWAVAAIETSSNQPVLPHAIIALNASEHDVDDKRWDVLNTTDSILNDLGHTVNHNVTFMKWAQFWRERGKAINTLVDLILCYYSSIQIIRLPAEGRPRLMKQQVGKLYDATLTACISARCARYQARMLLDVEDLNNYLQEAFNHYSNTLESPFDFVQASSRNSPIPPDFGGNILKLALDVMKIPKPERQTDARRIFSELSYMVASCIMLDSARHNNKGSASQIFPKYISHLDDAIENFCDQYWPCEFVNPETGVRCVNVRSGHASKGHQSADGKVFAAGDWTSKFSFESHRDFRDWVYYCLLELLKELTRQVQGNGEAEQKVAARIHKTMVLGPLFCHTIRRDEASHIQNIFLNNMACFCCLFGQAEHCLPCGHILCIDCVNTYGHPRGPNWLELFECPFLCHGNRSPIRCVIYTKPKLAGTRLITLDGGGIRGVVELEVLRRIEMELGGLPFSVFTGGLVALGLASMNWRVDECIEQFEGLCDEAFIRCSGSALPLVGHLVDHHHHSKYQTKTMENALKEAFSNDIQLFGGEQPPMSTTWQVKVAVTATALIGNKTYVLGNYNGRRENKKSSSYHFQRPQLYSTELKVWEAARATSAAPRYFKSFHHEASQKTYIDGAVSHNNPVNIADSERKVLWPDSHVPDLFLSIGTGSSSTLSRVGSEKMSAARKGILSHTRYLYGILRNTLEQTLDCDKAWDDFIANITTSPLNTFSSSRFIRINPDVGQIPALDDKTQIPSLRTKARESLSEDPRVPDIAKRLIASTFYFEQHPVSNAQPEGSTLQVQGKIRCRLLHPSREMYLFGQHLRRLTEKHGTLTFTIFEDSSTKPLAAVPLATDRINALIGNQGFEIGRVRFIVTNKLLPTHIYLCFGQASRHCISGFPRCFTLENQVTSPKSMAPNIQSNSSASRYTHGSRRGRRTSDSWKPPDVRTAPSFWTLHDHYNRLDHILGYEAMKSDLEELPNLGLETEILQQDEPLALSENTSTTEPREPYKLSTRRAFIREAFKALLVPLRIQKSEIHSPQDKGYDGSMIRRWLEERKGDHDSVLACDGSACASPTGFNSGAHYYNVSAAEYDTYEQWIGLLGCLAPPETPDTMLRPAELEGSPISRRAELEGSTILGPAELQGSYWIGG
ncbi:hypothetical protein F5Y08DRAFT_350010 [Xylaria arbuscula]|nr:hypothetical protein F5Y08DRAFT_350010 [Xylaria arbuscula]